MASKPKYDSEPKRIRKTPKDKKAETLLKQETNIYRSHPDYKLQVNAGLLDYICNLEQQISQTKARAERQKNTVIKLVSTLGKYFGLKEITQSTIREYFDSIKVQFPDQIQESVSERQQPDWFEFLQEKRMETVPIAERKKQRQTQQQQQVVAHVPEYKEKKHSKKDKDQDYETEPKKKYRKPATLEEDRKKKKVKTTTLVQGPQIPSYVPTAPQITQDDNIPAVLDANGYEQNGLSSDQQKEQNSAENELVPSQVKLQIPIHEENHKISSGVLENSSGKLTPKQEKQVAESVDQSKQHSYEIRLQIQQ